MQRNIMSETSKVEITKQFHSGLSASENPDKVIANKGFAYIEDIERDTHLESCLNTRIQNVLSKGWKITPPTQSKNGKIVIEKKDQEITDFVKHCLEDIPLFESDVIAMFDAISKGFSLSEIIYKRIKKGRFAGKIGLKKIKKKNSANYAFDFDQYGNYTLKQFNPEQKKLDLDKFVHFISGRDDENPYGSSATAKVAFWVWLKKNGAKFWAIYAERFGMPLGKVVIPRNVESGSTEYQKAQEVLDAMLKDSGVIVPEGFTPEWLEATRSGSADYDNFIERCNKEISKCILGQTLSNEEGKRGQGSYALGAVHQGVLNSYTLFDVIMSASAINQQVIRRLVDLNYDTERYPLFEWNTLDVGMLTVIAQNISNLAASGMRIPVRPLYKLLGINVPEKNEEVLQKPTLNQLHIGQNSKGVDNKASSESYSEIGGNLETTNVGQPAKALNDQFIGENDKIVTYYRQKMAKELEPLKRYLKKVKKIKEKDFRKKVTKWVDKPLYQVLMLGQLQGEKHGWEFVKSKFNDDWVYDPIKDTLETFISKNVITKEAFEKLSEEIKRQSFTIAGQQSEVLLGKVQGSLADVLAAGGTMRDFQNRIDQLFDSWGISPLSDWHCEVVARNNLQTAYAEAKERIYNSLPEDEFPYLQVMCVTDSSTRRSHMAFHGFVRKKSDPIWRILKTPFDHNCRCTILPVHRSEDVQISEVVPDMTDLGFVTK